MAAVKGAAEGGREGALHQLEVRGVLGVGRSGNLQGTEVHHCHFCLEIWRGRGEEVKSFNW